MGLFPTTLPLNVYDEWKRCIERCALITPPSFTTSCEETASRHNHLGEGVNGCVKRVWYQNANYALKTSKGIHGLIGAWIQHMI